MDLPRIERLAAAAAIGLGGYVHFRIWQTEYRHAPVREMFVANWVGSLLLAAALVGVAALGASPRVVRVAAGAGLALSLASLIGLGLSRGPGLPTIHGLFRETGLETTSSYLFHLGSAKAVLVSEALAAALCASLVFAHSTGTAER